MSNNALLGISIVGAIVAGAAGLTYAVRRRRSSALAGPSGRTTHQAKNGMRMTHIRDERMSIDRRVKIIQKMVWESINGPDMPELRKLALAITKDCPERDGRCEAKAIYDYVKAHVRYTGDIAPIKLGPDGPVEGIDLFQSAKRTLEFGGGDCDDHAIVNSVLLALNGIQPIVRVTAPQANKDYSHIYAMGGVDSKMAPKKLVALDTTLPGAGWFGKEVPYGKNLDFPGAGKVLDYPA